MTTRRDAVARAIWENMAQLTEYDAVTFDAIQERPRHEHIKQILRHAAERVLAALEQPL